GGVQVTWLKRVGWRHLVLVLILLFALFPIVFVISAAMNPLGTLSSTEIYPTGASTENFAHLFTDGRYPFANWFLNSTVIAGVSAFASVFLSICAAYAFSRMRFKGRR